MESKARLRRVPGPATDGSMCRRRLANRRRLDMTFLPHYGTTTTRSFDTGLTHCAFFARTRMWWVPGGTPGTEKVVLAEPRSRTAMFESPDAVPASTT